MAKSGTINGNRSGYQPYLRINWNIDQTDIPGNRTRLRLRLYLMHPYAVYYSATKSGKLQGVSFSSTKNVSGTGNTLLQTRYIWVRHNSDGTKTQNLNASFNIAITFSGSRLNSLSVSGNASLNRIPRKTDLTSASITSLKASESATLSIGRDVKHNGFYHLVSIYDGSTWIWDTGYESGSPSTSYTVKSSTVDKMLSRMKNVTKKTFRVRISTYTGSGGSGHIGISTRNVTVSVHSSVKPSASGIGADVQGSGKDASIDKFVQNVSRVYASFSSSVTGGAGVSSRSITIRKVGGADSQTISGGSGSTSREVRSSGTYEAIGTIRDTRGRTSSSRMTFTVHSYRPPTISKFSADREPDTPTRVKVERRGSHSNLGGDNRLTISVQKRQGSGSWTNVVSDTSTTSSSFGTTLTSTGNAVTMSYEFRVSIVDEFNNRAEATVTVPTQRVVLDIHKDEGVGIGKIHERGVLDIDGDIYSNGILYTVGGLGSIEVPAGADLNDYTANGFYHNRYNADTSTIANTPENNSFSLLVQRHAGTQQTFTSFGGNSGLIFRQYIRHLYSGSWGPWVIVSGNPTDNILWSGGWYMTDNHTATPSKPLSQCANGWMIQWSAYSGGVSNHNFSYTFIPKTHGAIHGGTGLHQIIGRQNYQHKTKYLYVSNTKITGSSNNSGDGIVMRRVYEW